MDVRSVAIVLGLWMTAGVRVAPEAVCPASSCCDSPRDCCLTPQAPQDAELALAGNEAAPVTPGLARLFEPAVVLRPTTPPAPRGTDPPLHLRLRVLLI
jgi:hypothetical protein